MMTASSIMLLQYIFFATYYLFPLEVIAHSTTQTDQVVHGIKMLSQERVCGPWHYQSDEKCQCYRRDGVPVDWIRCTNESALLLFGHCMTYEKGEGTSVSGCLYFQVEGHKVSDSEPGYIELSNNISELNDYMCGPMNRKGFLCRECIDGFGPSFTSLGYECSNCTNTYGIPLYLLIEFVPLTVFYLVILVFQVNLTTSPMTCFIYYSHLVIAVTSIRQNSALNKVLFEPSNSLEAKKIKFALISVYGMWNLDIFRYAVPPFRISSKLTLAHITILGYISVVYPLCLIIITWICVEIHGRNFRPLVLLWRPLHRFFVQLRRGWDTKSDIIDVFCTFLLLSYSKLVYQSLNLIWCQKLMKLNESGILQSLYVTQSDPYLACGHTKSILFTVLVSIILLLSILPPLLLILYPIKCFRTCLSRCRLDLAVINIFVEKFHCCYRDGLDGGRDMRSCSGFYFLLRFFAPLAAYIPYKSRHITIISFTNVMYTALAISTALIKPYKKGYMNISDTLVLSLIAILCHLITSGGYDSIKSAQIVAFSFLPALVFWIYVTFKLLTKLWHKTKELCRSKNSGCSRKLHIIMTPCVNVSDESEGNECNQPLIRTASVPVTVVDFSSS